MFTIRIETEGAAFHPVDESFPVTAAAELQILMEDIKWRLNDGEDAGVCVDMNGDVCGRWRLDPV